MGLCYIEKGHTYTLQEFKAAQVVRLAEVKNFVYKFQDFFSIIATLVPLTIHLVNVLGDPAPR